MLIAATWPFRALSHSPATPVQTRLLTERVYACKAYRAERGKQKPTCCAYAGAECAKTHPNLSNADAPAHSGKRGLAWQGQDLQEWINNPEVKSLTHTCRAHFWTLLKHSALLSGLLQANFTSGQRRALHQGYVKDLRPPRARYLTPVSGPPGIPLQPLPSCRPCERCLRLLYPQQTCAPVDGGLEGQG